MSALYYVQLRSRLPYAWVKPALEMHIMYAMKMNSGGLVLVPPSVYVGVGQLWLRRQSGLLPKGRPEPCMSAPSPSVCVCVN